MAKNNQQGNVTVLGEETSFDGFLSFKDNLVITGKFSGTIESDGNLEIAKTAVCDVDSMSASVIVVSGSVKGNIAADQKLEMQSGSKISGDITTKKLRIAQNVDFKGKVSMLEDEGSVDVFSLSPAEYKQALLKQMAEEA